jgi:acyl-homoserine-lactone acylase
MLDFPGVGWTDTAAITIRDANIENNEFIEQYVDILQAGNLDEFIEVHRTHQGVPVFNTIAVSDDGRAWYADTSATPRLSDEALVAYDELLETNPIAAIAAENGAVLLDGSDPVFEWSEVPGARDPGLVPFDEMPMTERSDYVFNANDSFWMSHATELLAGDYSPLHGRQQTARSVRTRENAAVLELRELAGDDGVWTLDELAVASVDNTGHPARLLRPAVVERCTDVDTIEVPATTDGDTEVLPATTVTLGPACEVLAQWDGRYNVDSVGAVLWREYLAAGGLQWDQPFDPADPLGTPSGLAAAPDDGDDPVLVALGQATQLLESTGLGVDVTLGEVQVAVRNGTVVALHGGNGSDGTPNQINWAGGGLTADPAVAELVRQRLAPWSSLSQVTGGDTDVTGYRVGTGTSFLLAVGYGPDGPDAKVFLTYSNTEDRTAPDYLAATEAYSTKSWRDVLLNTDDINDAAVSTITVRG